MPKERAAWRRAIIAEMESPFSPRVCSTPKKHGLQEQSENYTMDPNTICNNATTSLPETPCKSAQANLLRTIGLVGFPPTPENLNCSSIGNGKSNVGNTRSSAQKVFSTIVCATPPNTPESAQKNLRRTVVTSKDCPTTSKSLLTEETHEKCKHTSVGADKRDTGKVSLELTKYGGASSEFKTGLSIRTDLFPKPVVDSNKSTMKCPQLALTKLSNSSVQKEKLTNKLNHLPSKTKEAMFDVRYCDQKIRSKFEKRKPPDNVEWSPGTTQMNKGLRPALHQLTSNEHQSCVVITSDAKEKFGTLVSEPVGCRLVQIVENVVVTHARTLEPNVVNNQLESDAMNLEIASTQDKETNFNEAANDFVPPSQNNSAIDHSPETQGSTFIKNNILTNITLQSPVNENEEINSSHDSDRIKFCSKQNENSKLENCGKKRKKEMDPLLKEYLTAPKRIGKIKSPTSYKRVLFSQQLLDSANAKINNKRLNEVSLEMPSCSEVGIKRHKHNQSSTECLSIIAGRRSATASDANQRELKGTVFKKQFSVPGQKFKKCQRGKETDVQIKRSDKLRRSNRSRAPPQNVYMEMYLKLFGLIENKKKRAAQTRLRRSQMSNMEFPFHTHKRTITIRKKPENKKNLCILRKTDKKRALHHNCIDLGVTPVEQVNTVCDHLNSEEHHQPCLSVHCQNRVSVRKCRVRLQRIKLPACTETRAKPKPTQQSSLAASCISERATPTPPNDIISWLKQINNTHAPAEKTQIFHQMGYSARSNLVFIDVEGIDYACYGTEVERNLGYLRFRPWQSKPQKNTKNYTLHCIVLSGQFNIVINDEVGIFNAGDLVIIKKGSRYSIKNVTDDVGLLMVRTQ